MMMNEESQFFMTFRNVVTCFCKLVVHKVIPAKYLVAVVVNYTRFFDKFGDIIKVRHNIVGLVATTYQLI